MRTLFWVNINQGINTMVAAVYKEIEIDGIVPVGLKVEDPVLHRNEDPFVVKNVSLSLDKAKGHIFVNLSDYEIGPNGDVKKTIEIFQANGWKAGNE